MANKQRNKVCENIARLQTGKVKKKKIGKEGEGGLPKHRRLEGAEFWRKEKHRAVNEIPHFLLEVCAKFLSCRRQEAKQEVTEKWEQNFEPHRV